MITDWMLVGDDFTYLSEVSAGFVGFGLGLGALLWVIGYVVYWLTQLFKY